MKTVRVKNLYFSAIITTMKARLNHQKSILLFIFTLLFHDRSRNNLVIVNLKIIISYTI